LFRLLIDGSADVMWRTDKNHFFTYISPADQGMRGYAADEILGHHVFENLTNDGIATILGDLQVKQYDQPSGAQIDSTVFVVQQRCKDGSLIWTEVLSRFERDAQHDITGYHGRIRNITQQKNAEDELLRNEATLEAIPDLLLEIDLDGSIHFAHIPQASSCSLASTDLVGKTIQDFLPSDALPDALSALHEAGRHGTSSGFTFAIHRTQGLAWLEVSIALKPVQTSSSQRFIVLARDISHRKDVESKNHQLAMYDPLTGLPNRRMLMDNLTDSVLVNDRDKQYGALLFIDLDNFKTLNDTLGHALGDDLLRQVAQRLRDHVRTGDHVARMGGDEFAVLLPALGDSATHAIGQAELLGMGLISLLGNAYQMGAYAHHITSSIGITIFGDQHEAIDGPLRRADLAMYQAKAAGKNTICFFNPSMQTAVSDRALMEAGLRAGLRDNQFELYYQAQVAQSTAGNHRVVGAEVLLRWRHPTRGMVSPAEFIPLAEDTGLIIPLGQWVLETACVQLALWAQLPALEQFTLAINVSAKQLQQSDFVDQVLDTLARTGANPRRLKLEITENMLISNMEEITSRMHALKRTGIGFSLDDFGTGYSSLAYLKRMPLDQLKIDQGFVREILHNANDAAICQMVIALANSMNLAVIAEGVETEEQRHFLMAQGCHLYQGYLFARPVACQEFEKLAVAMNMLNKLVPEKFK
jgi:diguanylate cyclase (GGDEF)-like protein/PAS domain S-box-containing protein